MLDSATGLALQPQLFSAPSKESLQLSLLALAVAGSPVALAFESRLGPGGVGALLVTKVAAYEAWNISRPGYGCFFPWVTVRDGVVAPADDWAHPPRIPALDNGQMAWAVLAVASALSAAGSNSLASRYRAVFTCMAANAKDIFYAGAGKISDEANILDVSAPVSRGNYNRSASLLADPFEGEAMTVLLDLYADWSRDPPNEREQMWAVKAPNLVAVNYTAPSGRVIATQQGFWFSAHEQWKTLLLPYFDVPLARAVFANAERVRTIDSARFGVPGLFAGVNDVTSGGDDFDYISAAGVSSMARARITRRDVVTPYGSFNVFLHNRTAGACWLLAMLAARRGQGPLGVTESLNINGTEICPLVTWDSKATTTLAMAGGVGGLVGTALRAEAGGARYARFIEVVTREHTRVFGATVSETEDFAFPTAAVPDVLEDWAACQP